MQEKVLDTPKYVQSPSLFDESPCGQESDRGGTKNLLVDADITSLFWKRQTPFIYPEPVKIQITPQRPKPNEHCSKKAETESTGNTLGDSSPIMLSQQRRKRPKEIRKSLKFMADSSETSFENSSATDSSCALEDEKDMFALNDALAFDSDTNVGPHDNSATLNRGQEPPKDVEETKQVFCDVNARSAGKVQSLAGFATASGKNVKVSNEALVRARALLEEEANTIADSHAHVKEIFKPTYHSEIPKETKPSSNVEKLKIEQQVCTAIGFNKVSGKNLAVSGKALARAKVLFEDIEDLQGGSEVAPVPELKQIRSLKVEKPPVAAEKKSFQPKQSVSEETKSKFVGFSTAGGKKCSISSEAIQRAQKLFDSIDNESSVPVVDKTSLNEDAPEVKGSNGFQTANGRSIKVSNDALVRAKKMFEETDENKAALPSNQSNAAQFSVGFHSASGKNVAVSEDALKKARALFDNLESESVDIPSKTAGLNTASDKSIPATRGDRDRPRALIDGVKLDHNISNNSRKNIIGSLAHQRNAGMSGFSTAGGKSVIVSEKALARAKKLFEETEKEGALVTVSDSGARRSESQSSQESSSEASSSRKRKSEEEIVSEEDEAWVSSPTIGKKRKKNPSPQLPSTPISGTPLSAFDNAPTCVSTKVLVLRRKARDQETFLIELKRAKKIKVVPKPGRYLENKRLPRSTVKQLIGKPDLPKAYKPYELLNNFEVLPSVCLVTAVNSNSFNFYAWEHFSIEECRSNTSGFQLGN